jgi:hypothetical protein
MPRLTPLQNYNVAGALGIRRVLEQARLALRSCGARLRCEAQFCGTKNVSNYFCLAENMQHEKALTPTMLVGVCAFQATK